MVVPRFIETVYDLRAVAACQEVSEILGIIQSRGWQVRSSAVFAVVNGDHRLRLSVVCDLQPSRRREPRTNYGTTDLAPTRFEAGYDDSSHFARAFRRRAGISPRQYRMSHTQQESAIS